MYLFGAGASCGCLPIVNQQSDRMDKMIDTLNQAGIALSETEYFDGLPGNKTQRNIQIEMINDLRDLAKLSRRHASIDTAAKKLFIKNDDTGLLKLKLGLSVFLICEQLLNPPDKRYDGFFAAILGTAKHDLPNNIRIVTWNYDFQFELSFMEYSDDFRIDASRSYLPGRAKFDDARDNADIKRFGIFKLNGSPTLYQPNAYLQLDYITSYKGTLDLKNIQDITRSYGLGIYKNNHVKPGISFAWEKQGTTVNIVETVVNNTSDAEVLVVVGYSFPFFNREIDREIIQKMPNLKKVYFQSPEANNLIERFHAISDKADQIQLIAVNDTQQFYLPNEL